MESDRMGYLLPALTEAKFNNQRDVVLNERRQNYENRPYGLAAVALAQALFPPTHPYHWITIGQPDDLRAATLDDVRTFFSTYYHPGNASLTLAGDVETSRALDLAAQYFGDIPRGPDPPTVVVPDGQAPVASLLLEDRIELPRLFLAWHTPAMFAEGDAALDLAADILAHGKTSRLYQHLVYERRVATDVSAFQHSRELSSLFQLAATAAAGVSLDTLREAMLAAVRDLTRDGPTPDELSRVATQVEAQFVYRLQTVGGFGGKGDQLNAYNVFRRTPGYFADDLRRYTGVTEDDVRQAVGHWLGGVPSVMLSVVPRERADLAVAGATPVEVS
jgi:zinc protease